MATDFDRRTKRLSAKDWSAIAPDWIGALPFLDAPGLLPSMELSDLEEIKRLVDQIPTERNIPEHRVAGAEIRPNVLHEALGFLHKAAHIYRASLLHVNRGMVTWAIAESYQSAYLASRAFLSFLGICQINQDNKVYLMDVWPAPIKGKRMQSRDTPRDEIQFIKIPGKIEQRHHWSIIDRVLRTSQFGEDNALQAVFENTENKLFPRSRNEIYYSCSAWSFEDLVFPCTPINLSVSRLEQGEVASPENCPDFSLVLASPSDL